MSKLITQRKTTLSLSLANGELMTSVEMSKLVNKRHDSVVRTIKFLLNENVLLTTRCGEYKDDSGKINQQYVFDKTDSLVICARLSPKLMKQIIDRWLELETKEQKTANWITERTQAKLSSQYSNVALDELYKEQHGGKITPRHIYSNEANMIDVIVLGCKAKEYRAKHNISEYELLRDFIEDDKLRLMDELQKRDIVYIEDGLDYHERKEKLIDFANRYRIKLLS